MSCRLLNDGASTRVVVIIEEHIEDILAVLNMCVGFSVQPTGLRFLQSVVVYILAKHLAKQQTAAKWILHMHKHYLLKCTIYRRL